MILRKPHKTGNEDVFLALLAERVDPTFLIILQVHQLTPV
jgi:hypothetical protein